MNKHHKCLSERLLFGLLIRPKTVIFIIIKKQCNKLQVRLSLIICCNCSFLDTLTGKCRDIGHIIFISVAKFPVENLSNPTPPTRTRARVSSTRQLVTKTNACCKLRDRVYIGFRSKAK